MKSRAVSPAAKNDLTAGESSSIASRLMLGSDVSNVLSSKPRGNILAEVAGVFCNSETVRHPGDVIGHRSRLGAQVFEAWLTGQRPGVIHVQIEQVGEHHTRRFSHLAYLRVLIELSSQQSFKGKMLVLHLRTEADQGLAARPDLRKRFNPRILQIFQSLSDKV